MTRITPPPAAGVSQAAVDAAIAAATPAPPAATVGTYYVDPTNGNNANDGRKWSTAVATIAQAVTLANANSGIGEIRLSRGIHNVSSTLVISQAVKLRGMGPLLSQETEIVWTGANDGSYVIRTASDTSTADFTQGQLSGFLLRPSATGNGGGAYTNVNGLYARNMQNNAQISDLRIQGFPGIGLRADYANSAVPAGAFPGYVRFDRVWVTGNNVNWSVQGGFTSVIYNMCAGDMSANTTDCFILDAPASGVTSRAGNHTFIGWKSEDNAGIGAADGNYFTINGDYGLAFINCAIKRASPGTKPWVNYVASPAAANRIPNTVPVSFVNCHTSNIAKALTCTDAGDLLKPGQATAGESFQIPLWPSETLFPTAKLVKADDRFVRADSTTALGITEVGAKTWTQVTGTWGISSNQAYTSASTVDSQAVVDAGVADCTVEVVCGSAVGNTAGLVLRHQDASNYFYWQGAGSFFSVVATTATNLAAPGTFTAGDVIKVIMKGTSFWFYKNGQLLRSPVVNTNFSTATKHGLRSSSLITARFDRFTITG